MKTKLTLAVLLAISIGLATSAFAQTLSVSPNPVCVGQPVTVSLTGVCSEGGASAKVNSHIVALTNNGSGNWSGTYTTTTSDKGIKMCSASDNCSSDIFNMVSLTVVELDGVIISADPSGSEWSQDGGGNYAALKSYKAGDVVTFCLDMTPNNATAASLITWNNNVTPSSDKTTATVPADSVAGPTPVYASACGFTTSTENVWIFWGTISYNFSGGFDSNDALSFSGPDFAFSLPNPQTAGNYAGSVTDQFGYSDLVALTKVEIIGKLKPAGIGSILGNIGFTFNPQIRTYNFFPLSNPPTDTYTNWGPGDESSVAAALQLTPVNDKIFEIDAPGLPMYTFLYGANNYAGSAGAAQNFVNYIYIDGAIIASDPGYWNSHVKATLTGNNITTSISQANSGNPTLPTTWAGGSGPSDGNW